MWKGVGKPSELKGSHDEVAKAWKSWSYKFETWFCSQWPAAQQALDCARLKGDDPVTAHDLLNSQLEDIDPIDAHLHVALVSLTQGMPYMTLSITPERSAGLMHGIGYALPMNPTTAGPTFDYLEEYSILLEVQFQL